MKTLQHKRPIMYGALFAPITPAVCFIVYACYLFATSSGDVDVPIHLVVFYIFLIISTSLVASYIVMLLVGLPCVLLLRSTGQLNWFSVCAVAVMAGVVALPAIFAAAGPMELADLYRWKVCTAGGGLGLLSGMVSCFVTGLGRR